MGWLVLLAVVGLVGGNLALRSALLLARDARLLTPAPMWRLAVGSALLLAGFLVWLALATTWSANWPYLALGLSYLATVICAWWFLGETLTLEKVFGTLILITGLLLLIRNSSF